MKARIWERSTLVGVRLHHAAEELKSEVPGSSGILWLKINKAIFIFNITTLSSDHMPFSFVYHVDCIILSLVSSAKCVCPGKHGSNIIYDREFRHSRTHGSQLYHIIPMDSRLLVI